jgi:hypothetical protein
MLVEMRTMYSLKLARKHEVESFDSRHLPIACDAEKHPSGLKLRSARICTIMMQYPTSRRPAM